MINKILIALLKEKNSVSVPKKGLIINVNIGENSSKAFVYNPSIEYTDIVEKLKSNLEIEDNEANIIIDGYCALMDSYLKKDGEFFIEGIGTLYLDNRGVINMTVPKIEEKVEAEQAEEKTVEKIEDVPSKKEVEERVEEKVEDLVEELEEENKLEEFVEKKSTKHFDESIASNSNTKKLDTILGEKKHKTFDSTIHNNTLGDKFVKKSSLEQLDKDITAEEKSEDKKDSLKSDSDKLSEIFSGKRGINSNMVDKEKVNSIFSGKNNRTMNDVLSELEDNGEIVEKPIKYDEPTDLSHVNSVESNASPEEIAKSIMGKDIKEVKGKKKIDAVTILFIVSIVLFLCVLAYYFMYKSGYDMFDMMNSSSSQVIEEVDMNL